MTTRNSAADTERAKISPEGAAACRSLAEDARIIRICRALMAEAPLHLEQLCRAAYGQHITRARRCEYDAMHSALRQLVRDLNTTGVICHIGADRYIIGTAGEWMVQDADRA